MRKCLAILIIAVTVATAVPAFADLQNVVVGGSIRIRGNWIDYSNDMNSNAFVEQRTRLSVRADFTDAVNAFIEIDDYSVWGQDFRSNYLTGIDSRANTSNDVELYQGYIEANDMWGTGLKARIGRQEIKLGSGWLVGTNDKNAFFRGLSFDGVRLTYKTDQFSVEGLWAKLAENSPLQEDGDIDLYAVYGSYLGIENVTLDAYWLFIRDAAIPWGVLDTHTVGLRGAGKLSAFDFEAEAAYQWLDMDHADNSDALAGNLEVGYTFDMDYTPRVFIGGAYFEGSDDDAPFNRLFSNWEYTMFDLGVSGNDQSLANMTNFWAARAGVSVMPTETLKATLSGSYLQLVEDICNEDNLGWEIDASLAYAYTKDLSFEVGYAHFFAGDALGHNVDDFNYFYGETKLCF